MARGEGALTQTCAMSDPNVDAAMAIADEFLATFNALDAAGHAATLAYRADDSVIGVYPAVYVVVETDAGSRIQARSSYAP